MNEQDAAEIQRAAGLLQEHDVKPEAAIMAATLALASKKRADDAVRAVNAALDTVIAAGGKDQSTPPEVN